MGSVLERAQTDIERGRHWKARDRLLGALVERADDDILLVLGEVHLAMRDLPAAGAILFATDRHDGEARTAEAAWRERYRGDPVQLFLSLPPLVRRSDSPSVAELREAARNAAGPYVVGRAHFTGTGTAHANTSVKGLAFTGLAWLLGLGVAACLVVGAWTIATRIL